MEPLDKRILIWPPGWADVHLDAQTLPEAYERTGEVAPARTSHEARVAIKPNQIWQTVLAQRLHDGGKYGLGGVVLAWLDRQSHRGSHIVE
jgi:hypothetical protein